MDNVVVLAAEIHWTENTPRILRSSIRWEVLKAASKPCVLAVRIASFAGPFAAADVPAKTIQGVFVSLLEEARFHGVEVQECQLDFDCAQRNLAGYKLWLQALRPVIHPQRLVITTLPAWLKEPAFLPLVREIDAYVLQVHSVPSAAETGRHALCDTTLARKWVKQASALGVPFFVALPTYWCQAGYASNGKLLGITMDSVQPPWPPETRLLKFATNADDLADLIAEWKRQRPCAMEGILWYRVPVATDRRNWHWATLDAVMAGRRPQHRLEVLTQGDNPIDLSLINTGEADEVLNLSVTVTANAEVSAIDTLPGWSYTSTRLPKGDTQVVFQFLPQEPAIYLTPTSKRGIGWLRYETNTRPQITIKNHDPH